MITFEEFIKNHSFYKHHALLLLSTAFVTQALPQDDFQTLAKKFCQIVLPKGEHYVTGNSHPDVFIADRERKILRLEDIKPLQEFVRYPPQLGKRRLFYIENCERLNQNAANSLLKILEEPSIHCLFLLTSSKPSLVLPTVLSRVQKITLSYPMNSQPEVDSLFEKEDWEWMQKRVEAFSWHPQKTKNSGKEICEILVQCEKIAKEYEAEQLRSALMSLVSCKLKKELNFSRVAMAVRAAVVQWKEAEAYHPSSFLWLVRIFLMPS